MNRTARDIELVAREIWWAQGDAELPPDMERWRVEARRLSDSTFAELLLDAEPIRFCRGHDFVDGACRYCLVTPEEIRQANASV